MVHLVTVIGLMPMIAQRTGQGNVYHDRSPNGVVRAETAVDLRPNPAESPVTADADSPIITQD